MMSEKQQQICSIHPYALLCTTLRWTNSYGASIVPPLQPFVLSLKRCPCFGSKRRCGPLVHYCKPNHHAAHVTVAKEHLTAYRGTCARFPCAPRQRNTTYQTVQLPHLARTTSMTASIMPSARSMPCTMCSLACTCLALWSLFRFAAAHG